MASTLGFSRNGGVVFIGWLGGAPIKLSFLREKGRGRDFVHITVLAARIRPTRYANCTDLFYSALRADVLDANQKHDAPYKTESVFQHEPFHVAVVSAAPV